jgi:CheY-like chemotaxis protein
MAERAAASAVLVVDDHQDTRDVLADLLNEAGYTVFTAPDGVSALARLRTHPTPLVVLLDWRMPGRDGIAVLQAMVTEAPRAQHHAYFLLTARPEAAHPLLAVLPEDLPVVLVAKPFDVDTLLALVARATTRLHLHQQAVEQHAAYASIDERSPREQRRLRRDGRRSSRMPIGSAEQSGATNGSDDTTRRSETLGQSVLQQRVRDQARGKLQADPERLAAEQRFQARIEGELTAGLRGLLHLTLSGTAATFDWHGRSFTLTFAGFVERTKITPSGGLAAYTLHAWCVAPSDKQGLRNFAEGELQVGLLNYLGDHGSLEG